MFRFNTISIKSLMKFFWNITEWFHVSCQVGLSHGVEQGSGTCPRVHLPLGRDMGVKKLCELISAGQCGHSSVLPLTRLVSQHGTVFMKFPGSTHHPRRCSVFRCSFWAEDQTTWPTRTQMLVSVDRGAGGRGGLQQWMLRTPALYLGEIQVRPLLHPSSQIKFPMD